MTYKPPVLYVQDYLFTLSDSVLNEIVDSDDLYGKMIFRDALPVKIVSSGKRALVLRASAPGQNTSTHEIGAMLSISMYADHDRQPDGTALKENGIDRAWAMFGRLDQILHAPTPLVNGADVVQTDRVSMPIESFDVEQNTPYLAATYDLTVHTQK